MDEQLPHTRPANGTTRKHMGVATSDPEYLPPVGPDRPQTHTAGGPHGHVAGARAQGAGQRVHTAEHVAGQPAPGAQPNYSRYISTPKKGRAIFTARQNRRRRRVKLLLGSLIVAAVALAALLFFVLR